MEPNALYVIGGQQKEILHLQKRWEKYKKGLILKIPLHEGRPETCVEYISPPEAHPPQEESILFKAGTIEGDKLYVCTETEILIYTLPNFEQVGYISLPYFNDVHHVRPTPQNTLLVAITGLDMVAEITMDGETIRQWNVLGGDPWERFSKETDYRRVVSTKPHQSHPNYVFQLDDDVWVTRFRQKDSVCLTNPDLSIPINVERPHDGIVHDNQIFFTTVNGHIIVANRESYEVEQVVDLNKITDDPRTLGWCRSLYIIDRNRVIVGFSRLRPSKIRENLLWVKQQVGASKTAWSKPSHIALYDIKEGKLCWEYNIEDLDMAAVFSIHLAK